MQYFLNQILIEKSNNDNEYIKALKKEIEKQTQI